MSSSESNLNQFDNFSHQNQVLLKQFKQASQDLLFMSESEYPFDVFLWESETNLDIDSDMMFRKIEKSPDTPIEFVDIDSFFRVVITQEDWHGDEEKAIVEKYKNLIKLLKENLTNIKVIRVGNIEIDVYIAGKTPSGDIAGLSTKVVET